MSYAIYYPDFTKTDSFLKIGGISFPKWTGFGMDQSIDEEQAGTLVRAADAGLLFLGAFPAGDPRNVRLTTRISSQDKWIPPLQSIQAGVAYEVECVAWLIAGSGRVAPADFQRKHVPGSIAFLTYDMNALDADGNGNLVDASQEALIAWTVYRPHLLCKLVAKSSSYNPWRKEASWSIEMREHQPLAKG